MKDINLESWLSENVKEIKNMLTTHTPTFDEPNNDFSKNILETVDEKTVISIMISYLLYVAINPNNTKSAKKLFIFSHLAKNKNYRVTALANSLIFTLRTHIPREKLISLHNYINSCILREKSFDPYKMALILAKRNPSKILKKVVFELSTHPANIDTNILKFQQILACKYNKKISQRSLRHTLTNQQKQSLTLLNLLITYVNSKSNLSIP